MDTCTCLCLFLRLETIAYSDMIKTLREREKSIVVLVLFSDMIVLS